MKPKRITAAAVLICAAAALFFAQGKPLRRSFVADAQNRYRVTLMVRSEVTGPETVAIGAKTYVKPFSRVAVAYLSWRATRRVTGAGADGTARIEEFLDEFSEVGVSGGPESEEADKLIATLRETLEKWAEVRVLRYNETAAGALSGLGPEAAPQLGEERPAVLTLWLVRALRPAQALPERAVEIGARWEEPRAAKLVNWSDAHGTETGEWLAAPDLDEPAVRLHLVQHLNASVTSGPEKPPEGAGRAQFHGESLATLALADGHLITASRSAMREITWSLAAVEGLPERPEFKTRLSVEVKIDSCKDNPCTAPEIRSGRRDRN